MLVCMIVSLKKEDKSDQRLFYCRFKGKSDLVLYYSLLKKESDLGLRCIF